MAVLLVACGPAASGATPTAAAHPQRGFDTFVGYRCQRVAAVEHDAATQVGEFRALDANSVAFAFPIYMPTRTSDVVAARLDCRDPRFETPPVPLLSRLVGIAHRAGLAVLLRPLVVLTVPGRSGGERGWRGVIAPTDRAAWFARYWAALEPYVAMAQADHVEHVAIESELDSLAGASQWPGLVARVRSRYTGDLVVDYSWNMPEPKRWRAGTSSAIDAYPDLTDGSASQSVARLVAGWDALLAGNPDYAIPAVSTVAIDEVGILAQVGAYTQSAAGTLPLASHPFDQSIQARWFAAACSFAALHHLRGIYFWGAWLTRNAGELPSVPSPSRPSDLQPASQAAIARCFS